ncbi:hypothetical protein G3O08_10440 [Cryomorpha ignava]|uniref:Cbb3-type cytochrome c oxidase subunit I n=1 Tax=Cryomorpha ignava TaxID=101383 RepID=A0A7K3WQW8_9FLAO|nr:hypothetical protein [Cryomorpha ignava]NEN23916.1 hypothetical protein [Cryomorpha ignava]
MTDPEIDQHDALFKEKSDRNLFLRKWLVIGFSIFLIAGILGLTMRYIFVSEIPFLKYKNVLHAHSHIAMMGWAFMLVTAGIMYFFDPHFRLKKVARNTLFLNTIAVIGMTITFILQGYAVESIAFSAMHLFTAYYFGINILLKLKGAKKSTPHRFLKWSIYWYLISSLGLLAIGPISNIFGAHHPFYTGSIQFFIHFQFNGWFTFGALAILIKFLEHRGYVFAISNGIWITLILSVILTYLLSVTFSTPLDILFYLNAAGVILQAIAYSVILKAIFKGIRHIRFNSPIIRTLFFLGIGSLVVKVFIQLVVVIPFIAVISYTIHNYVIAFIHLIMLGSITFTISALLLQERQLILTKTAKAGWIILATGFTLTELILVVQGTMFWMAMGFIPKYYEILFGASILLPLGIAFIIVSFVPNKLANTYQKSL